LAEWAARCGRRLAFRETLDPWAILVAEVMAQQTQVGRVDLAWSAFLARYPGPTDLAAATPADVLRAWAGLGYNRRALALHRAAMAMVERHGGAVPGDLVALEALPGVGRYTARAVAATAFGVAVAAVDTNIGRVVGRLLGGSAAAGNHPLHGAVLQRAADELVDPTDPRGWTHAMMDLGATVCRPRAPRCGECPLASRCRGRVTAADVALASASARASARPRARPRGAAPVRFEHTSRWLRGRIVASLREAAPGEWRSVPDAIGSHDAVAVGGAVDALVREGLLERDGSGAVRLALGSTVRTSPDAAGPSADRRHLGPATIAKAASAAR
jgi:A/G-specific adenine glycosylase